MMNSIPLDLVYEIFCRLPAKSIGRCRCVSKQWRSILCSADFTEYFSTNSRPSLLFAMGRFTNSEFLFFSSPQIQSKSSSVAATYFKLNLHLDLCGHASGLFCFRRLKITMKEREEDTVHHVICNPSIGQYVFLPKLMKTRSDQSFLGFDPIDKVFKVLSPDADAPYSSSFAYILTLGTGDKRWRKIHIPLAHSPVSKGICINGALYYLAREGYGTTFIVCFDVGSEKFKLIKLNSRFIDWDTRLINYKGKLGVISWPKCIWDIWPNNSLRSQEEVCIWVLEEDDEKQDWSEYTYTIPGDKFRDVECDVLEVNIAGVTAKGEIVLMNPNYYDSVPNIHFMFSISSPKGTLSNVLKSKV